MIKVKMNAVDLAELARLSNQLGKNWDNALLEVAKMAQEEGRDRFPKRTGRSAAAIDAWSAGHNAWVGQKTRDPYYSLFQEHGYKRHFAPGINAWVGKPKSAKGYYLGPAIEATVNSPAVGLKLYEAVDKL